MSFIELLSANEASLKRDKKPLDPFFIVGKLEDGEVKLVEGEEFDKIQSGIEAELEERGLSE